MRPRRHVVLATYGEPRSPAFMDQFAYSWRILLGLTRKIDAIPKPALPAIALSRARSRWQSWREHDYGSPLEPITEGQAHALAPRLAAAAPEVDWQVHVAYEYRQPLVGDLVGGLPADESVWVVPLYAAESAFTHALTREATATRSGPTHVLGALSPTVLGEVAAAHVRALTEAPEWHGPDVALVLAAHGTVLNPPTPIDTGRVATEALCGEIRERLIDRFGLVVNGWLNHTRGGRWTEPPIERALADVSRAGFSRLVYFPYGFLGDNAESELEGRVALAGTPAASLHLPCLNDAPALIDLIARQVLACAGVCGEDGAAARRRLAAGGCQRSCDPVQHTAEACELCAGVRVESPLASPVHVAAVTTAVAARPASRGPAR